MTTQFATVSRSAARNRFDSYQMFKRFVWEGYEPLRQEITPAAEGFRPSTNWARRSAPRYYRALQTVAEHIRPGSRMLDVGAYPGSFARLAQETFGTDVSISGCGMPVSDDFPEALQQFGIDFHSCNLDPDLVSPVPVPVGLPYKSESIDVLTGMEVIEHLYSLRTFYSEAHRVLKPGGVLYVTTNNILDRVGLLRLFRSDETNLDNDIDQTSIWSDSTNQWRGHVRFYSAKQLSAVGARVGLTTLRAGHFDHYEDPDVYVEPNESALRAMTHRWLRGDGSLTPWRPKLWLACLLRLGVRSFRNVHRTHIELLYIKR